RRASLHDQLRRLRSDDVNAEELVVLRIDDVLHEAVRFADDLRLRIRGEGELADLDVVAALLRLLLRETDGSDFGIGVCAVRHVVVVDRTDGHALDVLDCENAFGGRAVGEGRRRHDVADRIDARDVRAHEFIDLNEAALIDLDLRLVEARRLRHGAAAGRGEDELGLDDDLLALRLDRRLHAGIGDLTREHLRVGVDVDSLLLEDARELLRDILILDRQELRHHFDDRHLRAEAREDRRELTTDCTRADDQHRLRHFGETEDVIGVDDALAVRLDVRKVLGHGAHRENDVLRREALAVDLDRLRVDHCTHAGDALDLVLLEEELDAFRVLIDDALLAGLHGAEVELCVADGDAEILCFLDFLPDVGILQQRFCGDATAVKTGAAEEGILLDDTDFESELSGANPRHITAGTASDDDDVVILFQEMTSRCDARRAL